MKWHLESLFGEFVRENRRKAGVVVPSVAVAAGEKSGAVVAVA